MSSQTFENEINMAGCHDAKSKTEFDWFLLINSIFDATKHILHAAYLNVYFLLGSVHLLIILYVLYKSYWSPVLYVKELEEIGYDYIPRGPNRNLRIKRTQNARRLGSKLPPPYPNGWFVIAESCELRRKDVLSINVLGHNLCLYRTESGIPRCVDAYCPHLGANIAAGGKVCGEDVRCPLHLWSFGEKGENGVCARVPGSEKPLKGVSLKEWTVQEEDGAIWMWHDAEGRDPLWTISPIPETTEWGYRGRNEFIVNTHVMDIPENGADVAHLNAIHSASLISNLGDKYPFLLNFIGMHNWSAVWTKNDDHTAQMNLSHTYKFGEFEALKMDVVATQIGPGHVRLLVKTPVGPFLVSQSVTPISRLQQKVVHRLYSPAKNAAAAVVFLIGERKMFERYVAVWNNKCYMTSPGYVRTDKTIRTFRSWFMQFYSENSITFNDAMRDKNGDCDHLF